MEDIYILGIGRNSINIIELAQDCGYHIKGLIHYDASRNGEKYFNFPVIGSFQELISQDFVREKNFALSMGDLFYKRQLFEKLILMGGNVPSLIHPSCFISKYSTIERGVQILPHSIIEADSVIGEDTSITVNSVIAHNVKVGKHNLISGNVMVGAYCNLGNMTHIGQGSVIVSGKVKKIGDYSILGAGSVLISDMPSNEVWAGNPAKFIKNNQSSYQWM